MDNKKRAPEGDNEEEDGGDDAAELSEETGGDSDTERVASIGGDSSTNDCATTNADDQKQAAKKKAKSSGPGDKVSHEERWSEMYNRLLEFRNQNGHCLVPNRYSADTQLGFWVSAQRRQYKLTASGEGSSALTAERIRQLEDIGFQWSSTNPHHTPWETRYEELCEFVKKFGHAEVPIRWKENAKLSHWVSKQRHDYKLRKQGKSTRLSDDKIALLNDIGFFWEGSRRSLKEKVAVSESDVEQDADGQAPEAPSAPSASEQQVPSQQNLLRQVAALVQPQAGASAAGSLHVAPGANTTATAAAHPQLAAIQSFLQMLSGLTLQQQPQQQAQQRQQPMIAALLIPIPIPTPSVSLNLGGLSVPLPVPTPAPAPVQAQPAAPDPNAVLQLISQVLAPIMGQQQQAEQPQRQQPQRQTQQPQPPSVPVPSVQPTTVQQAPSQPAPTEPTPGHSAPVPQQQTAPAQPLNFQQAALPLALTPPALLNLQRQTPQHQHLQLQQPTQQPPVVQPQQHQPAVPPSRPAPQQQLQPQPQQQAATVFQQPLAPQAPGQAVLLAAIQQALSGGQALPPTGPTGSQQDSAQQAMESALQQFQVLQQLTGAPAQPTILSPTFANLGTAASVSSNPPSSYAQSNTNQNSAAGSGDSTGQL